MATLKYIARSKTFRAGNAVQITALHLKEAKDFIVRDVQKFIEGELKKSSNKGGRRGHYNKGDFCLVQSPHREQVSKQRRLPKRKSSFDRSFKMACKDLQPVMSFS